MQQAELNILKKNLPKKPEIQGRDKYFQSAVLIPLVEIDNEYHFLFQKRAAKIRQEGEICFPGGKYDPRTDKSYEQTVLRETAEELGLKKGKIHLLGQLDTVVAPMGVIVEPFLGIINIKKLKQLKFNKNEVAQIFTIPVSYFENNTPEKYSVRLEIQPAFTDKAGNLRQLLPVKELGLPERYTKPWGHREYPVFFYRTEHGPIWGITAELIREVVARTKCQ